MDFEQIYQHRDYFSLKRLTSPCSQQLLREINDSLPTSVNYPEKCTGFHFRFPELEENADEL